MISVLDGKEKTTEEYIELFMNMVEIMPEEYDSEH